MLYLETLKKVEKESLNADLHHNLMESYIISAKLAVC